MRTLVIGGTGFVGGYTALYLRDRGYDVTLMSRKPPQGDSGLNELPFVRGNYVDDDLGDGRLEGFDRLVFAACNDIKQMPMDGSVSSDEFFRRNNTLAVPRALEAARRAGIRRVAYLGSFYPQVAPEQIERDPYVKSRHEVDAAVRAMSGPGFNVCSLNAPYILGHLPGLAIPHLAALVQYAKGNLAGLPIFAPVGGTNHMTVHSVAQAIHGGLERGASGHAYLIGDANLTWKAYLEEWFRRAGNPQEIEVRSDEHPLFPDIIMYAGVGATVSYEPPAAETELLAYDRGVLLPMISEGIDAMG